jgi:ribosomal protein RSM22 (predicted rRNA methylase)
LLISFEFTFIELTEKLKDDFSEQSKIELAQRIEANYSKIRSVILEQEKSKDNSKPKELDIGDIGRLKVSF